MSAPPAFEVVRFVVAPAGGAVAVIELEGRPADPDELHERPVLLLEGPVEHAELPAIVEPDGVADGLLRASFAGPLELAVDPDTTYALALGRGPLVELPPPDGAGDAALEVRLARTVNTLRGQLHTARQAIPEPTESPEATAAREEAERAAAAAGAERDRLQAELDDARTELTEARDEAEELRGELINAQARIDHLEATNELHRVPRTPRQPVPPRRSHPRAPREEPTEVQEHRAPAPRKDHASLGRGVARALIVVLIALLAAALVVVVLQVRVL